MTALGLPVGIYAKPNEVADAIPFAEDEVHRATTRTTRTGSGACSCRRTACSSASAPLHRQVQLRAFLLGRARPGAVTRFSGRPAPHTSGRRPQPAATVSPAKAYSHEVSSVGFWPGGGAIAYPAFYAYAYPEPSGFAAAPCRPADAFYSTDLKEFILPYDAVRTAPSPDDALLAFAQSTYEAAANLAKWDRATLERPRGRRDGGSWYHARHSAGGRTRCLDSRAVISSPPRPPWAWPPSWPAPRSPRGPAAHGRGPRCAEVRAPRARRRHRRTRAAIAAAPLRLVKQAIAGGRARASSFASIIDRRLPAARRRPRRDRRSGRHEAAARAREMELVAVAQLALRARPRRSPA